MQHPLKHASSPVLRRQALNLSGRRCLLRTGKLPRYQRRCITRPSLRGRYQLTMAYSTRWSEALTSDLDRMASRNGLVAVLCGAAAGFAAGGLLGAWLATRRQRASTPQPRPLARIAVNDGAFEPPSAPPSNLGSLPVTPRGTDGGYDEDAEVKMVLVVWSDLKMVKPFTARLRRPSWRLLLHPVPNGCFLAAGQGQGGGAVLPRDAGPVQKALEEEGPQPQEMGAPPHRPAARGCSQLATGCAVDSPRQGCCPAGDERPDQGVPARGRRGGAAPAAAGRPERRRAFTKRPTCLSAPAPRHWCLRARVVHQVPCCGNPQFCHLALCS